MPTSRLVTTGNIAGMAVKSTQVRSEDGGQEYDPTIPAAKTGTLSTRTNDTDGELTMEADHGFVQTDVVDLYWDGGMRYDVDIGVVDVLDCAISGGTGDNLPTQGVAITAMEPQIVDADFDADKLAVIGALMGVRGSVSFVETTTIEHQVDLASGELWKWDEDSGYTNPLAGHVVDEVRVSQAGTAAVVFKMGVLFDSSV